MTSVTRSPRRCAPLLAAAALSLVTSAAAAAPRTIFYDGDVFTAAPGQPRAQAVAIEGRHVLAVGTSAQMLGLARPGSKLVDLGGRALVPGINDAHVHVLVPQGEYLNAPTFIPGPGPTLPDVLDLVLAGATTAPPGAWLYVYIGNAIFDDPAADRFALDTVSGGHPVALFGWSGHGIYLNTQALDTLGIGEHQPDPFGGFYERVPGTHLLNGITHEYAEFDVRRRLLGLLSDADLVAQYQAFAAQAVQFGYTSLQDMAVSLHRERVLRVLRQADLAVRVRSMCVPLTLDESCDVGQDPGADPSSRLTASGVKWITDGTPIERLASVDTAYADDPGNFGFADVPPNPLRAILWQRLTGGGPVREQALFHSVGDRAIGGVLDGLEQTGGPFVWQHRRTRIEHGDLLFPQDYGRVHDLGVVVVQNGTHLALTPIFAERFVSSVFDVMEPLQSLLDHDIPLALGTDGIGHVMSPWVDIYLTNVHLTHPSEAISLDEAVRAYTRGSAYAEFEEQRKGTLAPGMLADLAVLSQDVFTAPQGAIPATMSVLTLVGGDVVWDAGVLGPNP
jgi:predicted amidohydrolase YtcJ